MERLKLALLAIIVAMSACQSLRLADVVDELDSLESRLQDVEATAQDAADKSGTCEDMKRDVESIESQIRVLDLH